MFTGLPLTAHGADEIGLAAQEGRRLQHVDDRRRRRDLVVVVDVGQHRHADRLLHVGEDAQALVDAGAAKATCPNCDWPCRTIDL